MMSVKKAIILLSLLFIFLFALLSLASYTVRKQNALNGVQSTVGVPVVPPTIVPAENVPSATAPVETSGDAIDTDSDSLQYKTVSGKGFTIEVPLRWNSFEETINNCSAKNIVSNDVTIVIWPDSCAIPGSYAHTAHKDGYSINSSYLDQDIASKAVFDHIVDTFTIVQ